MNMKKALITGITGQDGSFLAEFLLDVSKVTQLGWSYETELADGIRLAYEDFLTNPMRAER